MSKTEAEHKELVRRFQEEVIDGGDLDRVDEFLADDYVGHSLAVPEDVRGPDGYRELIAGVRAGFPDFEATVEDLLVEDQKVVQRVTITGTHEGEFMEMPPTGNEVEIAGIDIFQIEDGKIAESWEYADMVGLMKQLGVGPGGPD